ncbi:hypothetical protein [Paenirhodobacter populi]|uniref:Uncharacterized protein n=1 Tax=Paenirhodobacter populi TaxID=2306993 RepID=A0A443J745_9RHOB|nr:hypothetical protein [Sinirhodobacter populi]RWR16422.1 hypothetical protein D2T30_21765 [Sinirhodobacter populi]
MGQITPEDERLIHQAISEGRVVRAERKPKPKGMPKVYPDRISTPKAITVPVRPTPPKSMSIQRALEWAFADEKAQLEFGDETGAHEYDREGVDPLWRAMQIRKLGCTVDGGGSNPPAADAQIIAAEVARLPEGVGGRQMSLQIVECARARSEPEWGRSARFACVPQGYDFDENTGERIAYVVKVGEWSYWDRNRHRKTVDLEACPVTYTGTAVHIASQRRNYHLWWGALLHLQSALSCRYLDFELTKSMPVMSPWRIGG